MSKKVPLELIREICVEVIKSDEQAFSMKTFDDIWENLDIKKDLVSKQIVFDGDYDSGSSATPDLELIESILISIVSGVAVEILSFGAKNLCDAIKRRRKIEKSKEKFKKKETKEVTRTLADGTVEKIWVTSEEVIVKKVFAKEV